MGAEDLVRDHYSRDGIEARLVAALADAGCDVDDLDYRDLSPIDNLHAGFLPATEHVVGMLRVAAGDRVLDFGSGIGGPARAAAALTGCEVIGVDLSPDFVETAGRLTDRVGLSHLVHFEVTAGALPFDDDSLDAAMMIHVGMNLEDKHQAFAEIARVLRRDAHFVCFEQMRLAPGALTYPLPWAEDERSSFVAAPDDYVAALEAAGFDIATIDDRTTATAGPPSDGFGALNPGVLFGDGFDEAVGNNIAATMSGLLGAVVVDATAR
jgi:SAM-dependent methyltransferase